MNFIKTSNFILNLLLFVFLSWYFTVEIEKSYELCRYLKLEYKSLIQNNRSQSTDLSNYLKLRKNQPFKDSISDILLTISTMIKTEELSDSSSNNIFNYLDLYKKYKLALEVKKNIEKFEAKIYNNFKHEGFITFMNLQRYNQDSTKIKMEDLISINSPFMDSYLIDENKNSYRLDSVKCIDDSYKFINFENPLSGIKIRYKIIDLPSKIDLQ